MVYVPKDYKSPSLARKFGLRQKCMNDANDLAFNTVLVIKDVWHFIVNFLKDYKSPSIVRKFVLRQKCMNDTNDLAYYTVLVITAIWHFIVYVP
jgi:hypothetical protein